MRMQLRMELEEQRQEGLATAERLAEHQAASHGQLQALQSALSIAKVGHTQAVLEKRTQRGAMLLRQHML